MSKKDLKRLQLPSEKKSANNCFSSSVTTDQERKDILAQAKSVIDSNMFKSLPEQDELSIRDHKKLVEMRMMSKLLTLPFGGNENLKFQEQLNPDRWHSRFDTGPIKNGNFVYLKVPFEVYWNKHSHQCQISRKVIASHE